MSKTTPATYTAPSLVEFSAGEEIFAPDPVGAIRNTHHIWSRSGPRSQILLKTLNPFETSSATLTHADDGADGFDLTRVNPIIQPTRPVIVAGNVRHQLIVRVYGRDFVVRVTLYTPDGAATISTVDITRATGLGWGWSTGTFNLTPAEVGDGGVAGASPRLIGVSLEARRETTKAELWQATIQEVVAASSSYLPSGA